MDGPKNEQAGPSSQQPIYTSAHFMTQDVRLEPGFAEQLASGTVIRRKPHQNNRLPPAWMGAGHFGPTSSPERPPPMPSSLEEHINHYAKAGLVPPSMQPPSMQPPVDNQMHRSQKKHNRNKKNRKANQASASRPTTPVHSEVNPDDGVQTQAQTDEAAGPSVDPTKKKAKTHRKGKGGGQKTTGAVTESENAAASEVDTNSLQVPGEFRTGAGGSLRAPKQRKRPSSLEDLFKPVEAGPSSGGSAASLPEPVTDKGKGKAIHGSFKGLPEDFDPFPRATSTVKVVVDAPSDTRDVSNVSVPDNVAPPGPASHCPSGSSVAQSHRTSSYYSARSEVSSRADSPAGNGKGSPTGAAPGPSKGSGGKS